jgi:hypothetical protein
MPSRRSIARDVREDSIDRNFDHDFPNPHNNGDEDFNRDKNHNKNFIGNYNKGLPHHTIESSDPQDPQIGEVMPHDYEEMVNALESADEDRINNIPRGIPDNPCTRKFTDPQAGLAFDLEGKDSHDFMISDAPTLRSNFAAGEMAELYWMALCRDINFHDYDTINSTITAAISDFNSYYSDFKSIRYPSGVSKDNIFRGILPGDLEGPFISQFLLRGNNSPFLDKKVIDGFIQYGSLLIDQRQGIVQKEVDFISAFDDWLQIQIGFEPRGVPDTQNPDVCKYQMNCGMALEEQINRPTDGRGRYIRNLRDLTNYVHFDDLPQEFLNACLILKHLGIPENHGPGCSPQPHGPTDKPTSDFLGNPYLRYKNQEAIATFGDQFILTLVAEVARRALYAAWYQKWFVHRRLRPEEFAGRIHLKKTHPSVPYHIDNDILSSPVLQNLFQRNQQLNASKPAPYNTGTYLLPQAYPEGSPLHPSYPSGHATISGACVTVLKAYFDEDAVFPEPVMVDASQDGTRDEGTNLINYNGTLKVGNELNKLASNIAIGRNAAGIHYFLDYYQGVLLGEKVAISLLEDLKNTFNESYAFRFTKFDGSIKIIGKS